MSEEHSVNKTPSTPVEPLGWGVLMGTVWAGFAFFGPRLVVTPIVQLLMSLPFSADTRIFLLEAIVDVMVFAAIVAIIRAYGLSLKHIGLEKIKLRYFGIALLMLPLYFMGSIIAVRIVSLLFPRVDITAQQQIGFTTAQGPELILVFIALVVVPPIVEEIVFRGFLLRAYERRFGIVIGSIIISLLFALLHSPVVVSVDVFVLSLFLCYARTKTNSLWTSIFLHACKNFVAFSYLFIIGGK